MSSILFSVDKMVVQIPQIQLWYVHYLQAWCVHGGVGGLLAGKRANLGLYSQSRPGLYYWVPAVIHTFQGGTQKGHELRTDLYQVQKLLAVRHEALQFLRAGEQLTEGRLLVELRLGDGGHFDVREGGAERPGGHLEPLQDV